MTVELSPSRFHEVAAAIEAEVARVIVGQRDVVRHTLIALLANGHMLLEGLPGLGKTMLVRTLASTLQLDFGRVQFTPDLMPADIIGTDILEVADTGERRFRFHRGPVFTNLLLADEINRATPKTQSALLEAMQEHRVTVQGRTYELTEPFFVFATQNPIELEGTYPLPEAQLDRFMFQIDIGYPSAAEEVRIAALTSGAKGPALNKVLDPKRIVELQDLVLRVPVAEHVLTYAVAICRATRPAPDAPPMVRKYVSWGAGPRASQHLVQAAKARAALAGRFAVSIDDVRALAAPVLVHRIVRNFHAEADGVRAGDLVASVVESIPTQPRP
jgi:MoxR-like ATPase